MATRSALGTKVQEGETFTYRAIIRDSTGVVADLTDAGTTVLLDYYRDDTNAAQNGRMAQSVITAGVASNNHTGDASGNLVFKSIVADTVLAAGTNVVMVLRYTATFDDAAFVPRTAINEATFTVENLVTVT